VTPEFSRLVPIDTLGAAPRDVAIEAEEAECAALAARFGLVAVHALSAEAAIGRDGDRVSASGLVRAAVTQSCVASGEPVEARVEAPFRIEFRPLPEGAAAEEVELDPAELNVVFYEGASVDLGEAAAETLSLALDPYPRAPDADEKLRAAGVKSETEAGPFAALAALRDKMTPSA
jgi:uncharacterized metal-binding protein YceD (DUF177 family)